DLASKDEEVPSIPRGAVRQRHCVNVPAQTPKEYWKRALFFPFLDHLIQELQDRLVGNEARFHAEYLIPIKLQGLSNQVARQLFETFGDDLPAVSFNVFDAEIGR
ncbi:MAG: hypothetical protein N0C90_25600, partial [Candidatus Thiodiazotropha endolucinida]|nr:hypothetical protein [Candidatus Thiodiazotropha taylori]MCW4264724.1 hypothetical protein [Candidatus Thiodiazotropha endolucinida]